MRVLPRSVAVAAAALGVVALAGPAFAAGPYTITVGTKTSGSVPFTSTSGAIQFKTSSGLDLGCDSGTANGNIVAGPDADGVGIASITTSSFTNCRGPLNLPLNVKQTKAWRLNATGKPADSTAGTIDQVTATVSNPDGQCSFAITGAVDAKFTSSTQVLAVAAGKKKLKISKVVGCFGTLTNGDTATFTANYAVKNSVGKIVIK